MIRVPTYVAQSPISGLGLFSSEFIPQGTLIWSFQEKFDQRFSEDEYKQFTPEVQQFMDFYGYKYIVDQLYYLPGDNDRFVNHADEANTFDNPLNGNIYAKRDIFKDEEITLNYREFDTHFTERFALAPPNIKPLTGSKPLAPIEHITAQNAMRKGRRLRVK